MKQLFFDSEFCSMGRWIALVAAEKLGLAFYDDQELFKLADPEDLNAKQAAELTEWLKVTENDYQAVSQNLKFRQTEQAFRQAVQQALAKGPCAIHERGSVDLKSEDTLAIMIYNSDVKDKSQRVGFEKKYSQEELSEQQRLLLLKQEDQARRLYKNAAAGQEIWGKKEYYDLCIDTAAFSKEKCVDILVNALSESAISNEDFTKIVIEKYGVVE
ncbi:hypothetical protein NRIC_27390 [Enterococcus florum]|uniref:Cytidylate kinase n=1 Tax=Enterococcus florum TaxID=2480627 RepID=A0A4P5PF48_9ENTE|nr:cytidylate kinase family protein [Enterococcus florum]GCF94848.1 hypothetical protein NRIC_27390 [Enterococcus florum]